MDAAGDAAPAAMQDWSPSMGVASVTGTIKFDGEPPKRRALDMGSDASCHDLHSGEAPVDESIIVSADGGLQNVFVWVKKGHEGYKFATPSEPVLLDQTGCVYTPHVVGLMKGQKLQISNSDPVTHNVHTYSKKNPSFNKSQPAGTASIDKVLNRDEGMFRVACDMHGWMNSYVAVVDNPFFAVSDASGKFDLGKLPPGEYSISAEHEVFGTKKGKVTIAAGDTAKTLDFTFTE
jgi:plastocyanin